MSESLVASMFSQLAGGFNKLFVVKIIDDASSITELCDDNYNVNVN